MSIISFEVRKMKIWSDEEVKSLFNEVEKCKKEQNALRTAFYVHAKQFNRKPNSVRNYYYREVDNLLKDKKRANRLGLNLDVHDKTHFINFEKVQEEELFEEIEKRVAKGQSVRSACLDLSKGKLPLMTRYQNKYQNMKRKIENKNNIIPFKRNVISDEEINSLFMGLVRLIKRTAQEQASPNALLNKTLSDLNKKEQELENLKQEFEKIKAQNRQLLKKCEQSKTDALALHIIKTRSTSKDKEEKV